MDLFIKVRVKNDQFLWAAELESCSLQNKEKPRIRFWMRRE
jgi:hypothetical protein